MELPGDVLEVYNSLMKIMGMEWPALKDHIGDPEILEVVQLYLDAMTQRKDSWWTLENYYTREKLRDPLHLEKTLDERNQLRECTKRSQAMEDAHLKRLTKLLHYREMDYQTLLSREFILYKY